jgi:hypothetical protein
MPVRCSEEDLSYSDTKQHFSDLQTKLDSGEKKGFIIIWNFYNILLIHMWILADEQNYKRSNTGYTQKNGAVSKVNKKLISYLTRAQHTPSAAETVQVSHALPAVRFSCLMRRHLGNWPRGPAFKHEKRTAGSA